MTVSTSAADSVPQPAPPRSLEEVPGWFHGIDQQLFAHFLEETDTGHSPTSGDLLEMGCYLGKSAIVLGRHLHDGQVLTVCDLFADDANGDYSRTATRDFYRKTLSRQSFEANYRAFHGKLPEVVEGRTAVLPDRVRRESCRFVHIDASHMYEDVRADIGMAGAFLREDGIVALDDYRTEHTPGVAAAVWEAVFTRGLRPVCVSPTKMYATWGDPERYRRRLHAWATGGSEWTVDEQHIGSDRMLRIAPKKARTPRTSPTSRGAAQRPEPGSRPTGTAARRLAVELLPPAATRVVRRLRSRR